MALSFDLQELQTLMSLLLNGKILPQHTPCMDFSCAEVLGQGENWLFHGNNAHVLSTLLQPPWMQQLRQAGGVKLVYMDPPFAVGADFAMNGTVPQGAIANRKRIAYTDKWGTGDQSFYTMLFNRLCLVHELLADDGSIMLHCDWRTSAAVRLMLDVIFGKDHFLGEIIWHYTGGGRAKRYFSRKHDTIFHYAKSSRWIFNVDDVRVPYKPTSGYAKGGIVSKEGKRYVPNPLGTPVDDVWDIPIVNPMSAERLAYPTQKPEALLERIILACSRPNDIVADFFCGSGTTLAVAQRLGRRWIGADKGNLAISTTYSRMVQQHGVSHTQPSFSLFAPHNNPVVFVSSPFVLKHAPQVQLEAKKIWSDGNEALYVQVQPVLANTTSNGIIQSDAEPVNAIWQEGILAWGVGIMANTKEDAAFTPLWHWSHSKQYAQFVAKSDILPLAGKNDKVCVYIVDFSGEKIYVECS